MTDEIDGLNVTEAAAYLGLSRTTVYALLKQGLIPHRTIGTQPRFSRAVLSIWLGGDLAPGVLAGIARLARAAGSLTPAPTGPPTRLTPKHIGGRRPPSSAPATFRSARP